MDKLFNDIINDRTSGSSELLEKLVDYFKIRVLNGQSLNKQVDTALGKLGHFAIIKYHLDKLNALNTKGDYQLLISYLSSIIENEASVYHKIFSSIPIEFQESRNILTLSNSKTVYEILKIWSDKNKDITISVLESLPEYEGNILVKKLSGEGINAKSVHDSAVAQYLEKADLLLLGCDTIMKNGDIINKTGSRNAAVLAKHFNKPVLVVSSRSKRIKSTESIVEGRDKSEKFLFETVEKELITKTITD